jgi:hypothetical protein
VAVVVFAAFPVDFAAFAAFAGRGAFEGFSAGPVSAGRVSAGPVSAGAVAAGAVAAGPGSTGVATEASAVSGCCASFDVGSVAGAAFLRREGFFSGASPAVASALAATFLARFAGAAGGTAFAIDVVARSMLLRAGAKLSTTRVTASPIFMNSRALRGGGSDISRSGT